MESGWAQGLPWPGVENVQGWRWRWRTCIPSLLGPFRCCSVPVGRILFLTPSLKCLSVVLMPVVCVSMKGMCCYPTEKRSAVKQIPFFHSADSREESVLGSIPLPSYVISPVGPEDRINRKFSFKVRLQSILANLLLTCLFALEKL